MLSFLMSLFMFQPSQPLTPNFGGTRYDAVTQTLRALAEQYSHSAELIEIGTSDSGLPIYGLKIGSGPVANMVVATHHGNEYGSTAVALGFAKALAQDPMAEFTTYIIPVLNISGYNSNDRYEKYKSSSQDPNRDYPGPCATDGPFKLKSTKALADFVVAKGIVASATLHTYSPAVLYPWGISTHDLKTSYESTFVGLAKAAVVESGYDSGNSTELLYAADGTYEDYAYWKHGIWSLLFELGYSHSPSQSDMDKMVTVNVPGLKRFFAQAPRERALDHSFTGKCDRSVRQRTQLE